MLYLDLTKGVEPDTQRKIAATMVRTTVGTTLMLVVLDWFLMRLLHLHSLLANLLAADAGQMKEAGENR